MLQSIGLVLTVLLFSDLLIPVLQDKMTYLINGGPMSCRLLLADSIFGVYLCFPLECIPHPPSVTDQYRTLIRRKVSGV